MALIELLEHPDWEDALRRSFTTAITLLQTDRFRLSASAVDDMRSWLTRGGAPHGLNQLRHQMEQRRLLRSARTR